MKIAEPYRCDGCGKLRTTDANHWWLLRAVEIAPRGTVTRELLQVEKWDAAEAADAAVKHLCGQECAQRLIAQWMVTGSLDPPSSKPISAGNPTTLEGT